ncbi:MAG: HTTM domain-containing protein [Bacteroidetes bacterium]|nr:HTTM domain-containing protein [Bacteroidota bacterium]
MMFAATLRFVSKGWVDTLFVQPSYFFTFYGFEWIKPLSANGMYTVFGIMMLCSILIATGLLYRVAAIVFFLLFTYVELIDKTNYLNHYYFISIMAGILCLLPANKAFSLDVKLGLAKTVTTVPTWAIFALQLQMAMVYFFAGISKINPDWLLNAMPLRIWLPAKADVPIIGAWLTEQWVAYAFCWIGMLFDVFVAFFLFNKRTVWYAYAVVVVFHVLTAILFPGIGMFPFIMIVCATIFLPAVFHERLIGISATASASSATTKASWLSQATLTLLVLHFSIQAVLPFRYMLYPGKLFYTEQGYRFSWRVMLMEKVGYTIFNVRDAATGKSVEVNNRQFLSLQQEKQMSTQPDMILQFAQHLKEVCGKEMQNPEVYAEAYVTINGRSSRLLIDPKVNLAAEQDGFANKKWILAQADK